ncbi:MULTISPECIES: peptidase U32 family protein [unclassified Granulicatella]|uniref:peptidase U32 family protein n=1 Tax=unclassified Granulicatella TaxID=2630493 RepID=UPI00107325BC|nr:MULTISPECIES: peptidase U32 family protein [unclassified Granulicatella]MBF0780711.1 U32 family peptidase [Granulicatella sp. 19428wC4_WM01]TFU94204.1 U32 family peptidase [Granulicatella sp. WM01]
MIEIIATVESIEQAKQLLEIGVDVLYFGEDTFGLRLPKSFTRDEQRQLCELAHQYGKKVSIALNAIFHNDGIRKVPEYLTFLKQIHADTVTLGDPGVVQIMKNNTYHIPYRYDAQVVVTSSRQINFWAKRGAVQAVVAREVPKESLEILAQQSLIPVECLVYGATCIHQSRRPLLQNYFNYIKQTQPIGKDRGFFLSEPKKPETHYSIYEDVNGTHIFANNDVLLAQHLEELYNMGIYVWKLDGLFTSEHQFVDIAHLIVAAKQDIMQGAWSVEKSLELEHMITEKHPKNRGLDTGFYLFDPNIVK